MSNKKLCSICLNTCVKPLDLTFTLYCNCKYNVHYKCFYTWWKDNKTCIICHKTCGKPLTKKELTETINRRKKIKTRRNRTPVRRHNLIDNVENIIMERYGVDTRQIVYPIDRRLQYIEDYLQGLQFDNENELKTLITMLVIILIFFFFYKLNVTSFIN